MANVAASLCVARRTLTYWVARSKKDGIPGLLRKKNPGSARPPKHPEIDTLFLCRLAATDATQYGYDSNLWTCRRIHQVVTVKMGARLSRTVIFRRLKEAGLTCQKPEKRYFDENGDEERRQQWLRKDWPEIQETVRRHKAILYFEDEAHIALSPVVGRTWAPRGKTPSVAVTSQRGGFSAMSAISAGGSLLFRLFDHRIRSGEVIDFLSQMLCHHPRRHLVVVMDNASPHKSAMTLKFISRQKRLHVFWLPARSPKFNPDEKVWHHLKYQELKSHQAKSSAELMEVTQGKMECLAGNPSKVRGIYFWGYAQDLMK